jgi:hypothetical protein
MAYSDISSRTVPSSKIKLINIKYLYEHLKRAGPVHALWGIPKNSDGPAVLVTVYRPDPLRWDESFTVRAK